MKGTQYCSDSMLGNSTTSKKQVSIIEEDAEILPIVPSVFNKQIDGESPDKYINIDDQ